MRLMRVYKYPAPVEGEFSVTLPIGATVLSVGEQAGELFLWALVDVSAKTEPRWFHWRGTGHPADYMGRFVGTVQTAGGLVFHLFEAIR